MSFNTKEQEIIKWGLANGKTKEQVTQALTNFRTGVVPKPQEASKTQEGYLSRVGSDIKGRFNEMGQSQLKNEQSGFKSPLSTGANIAKNLSGIALSPIAQAPGLRQVGEAFGKAGQVIVDTKVGDKVTDLLSSKFSDEQLGTAADVIETGLNVAAIQGTVGGVKSLVGKGKNLVSKIEESATPKEPPPPDPKVKLKTAIDDATPDYESSTPTGKGKLLDRTQEGGFLKGRTVEPSKLEIEAGTELSKIPGYEPASTKLSKYQVAKTEVAKRGQALEQSLKDENISVPKREVANRVKSAINEVPNKSLLLQKSDPVMNNYMRVLKNAQEKVPGTLDGVLKLRKMLDDAYENARGKQAFGSDKISALDDVHTAARNALTEYLIEMARSTDVKASLRSQWNLYRAMDMLKLAAEKESGSVLGRTMQKYPITTKAVKAVTNATGIGSAVNVLTP